jgi:uncharacterized protein (TIGR03083 family)
MKQTLLTLDRYLDVLEHDTETLADVLKAADPSVAVRSCPGWTLSDLGYHVGEVHRFWNWVVREAVQEVTKDNAPQIPRPDDAELAEWLRRGLADLLPGLRTVDPSAPAWSWTPQRDMAFIQRRMPHETSVHRWDAQDAVRSSGTPGANDPAPIAADLATDGISEFLLLASATRYETETRVALHATDTDQHWTVWLSDGEIRYVADVPNGAGGADAPVTISGAASDLLLVLWRRLSPAEGGVPGVHVTGDGSAAREFLQMVDLD